jgi:hypothetical protein
MGFPLNSRSLHCAPPDFLWRLLALAYIMRPSLRKVAHAALSNVAWQEIRVRSGRDDNFVAGWSVSMHNKFVIPTGEIMALRPT